MVKDGKPRRGSLQFSPRKRARKPVPRVRSWPESEGVLGFVGYKVGMLTALVQTTNSDSPVSGKKVSKAATVVEVPPLILRAVRFYKKTPYGSKVVGEVANAKDIGAVEADAVRFIFETQPKKAGFPKKLPEDIEIAYGGDPESAKKFAAENLGKELRFGDIFSQGEFVDFTAVTKGRGFQGPVKRFGVKLLPHKTEKSRRKPGSLGPWTPKRTAWQVPMAGQTGYHARTEYNKQIIKLGHGDINPKSGWRRYGVVKSDYALILGTVPGPAKRTLMIRKPSRNNGKIPYELQSIIMDGGVKK
jgi:large subunit ribosomal protein L3